MDLLELEKSQKLYKEKKYEDALIILEALWNESNKKDYMLLHRYGLALRKCNKQKEYINIYKTNEEYFKKNIYVLSQFCWCIYEVYIKGYSQTNLETIELFLERSNFIVKNQAQLVACNEILNPYVLTVKKVVKIYNDKASTISSKQANEEIIKWLNRLNPDILSENCLSIKIKEKDFEQASTKEFYYTNISKAYEKLERYEECIKCIEKAFDSIKKFHYRNNVWLKARLHYCKCMQGLNLDEDIENYRKIAVKENFWFMWYKLGNICLKFGKMEKATFFYCKAINVEYSYEKMVTLFYNLGICLQAMCELENSKIFFELSGYYKNKNFWNISEELEFYINEYNLDIEKKPNINLIKKIVKEYTLKNDEEYIPGKIKTINYERNFGFITQTNGGEDIYFKINKYRLNIGDKIVFKKYEQNNKIYAENIERID